MSQQPVTLYRVAILHVDVDRVIAALRQTGDATRSGLALLAR